MSIEVLTANPKLTEEHIRKIQDRIKPKDGKERQAWCPVHAFAFEFLEEGRQGLLELTREIENKTKKHRYDDYTPGSTVFWNLSDEKKRRIIINLAGVVYGSIMPEIESALTPNRRFDARETYRRYNRATGGTIISPIFPSEVFHTAERQFDIPAFRWRKMIMFSQRDPSHEIFFKEGFPSLPMAAQELVRRTETLDAITTNLTPRARKLIQTYPQQATT